MTQEEPKSSLEDVQINDMRIFVVAKFSSDEFYAGRRKFKGNRRSENGRNARRDVRALEPNSECVKDGVWEVWKDSFLSAYVPDCRNPEKQSDTFQTLKEAKKYFVECRGKEGNWKGGGITKERNGVFTIREGKVALPSNSCEISWIYIAE